MCQYFEEEIELLHKIIYEVKASCKSCGITLFLFLSYFLDIYGNKNIK